VFSYDVETEHEAQYLDSHSLNSLQKQMYKNKKPGNINWRSVIKYIAQKKHSTFVIV